MKKLIALFLLIALSLAGFSQEFAKVMVGGSLRFEAVKSTSLVSTPTTSEIFEVSPMFGIILYKKNIIGLIVNYKLTSNTKELSFTPFFRINSSITDKFIFISEPYINLSKPYIHISNYLGAGINFGFCYFIKDNISLELNLINFSHTSNVDGDITTNIIKLSHNLTTPHIGVRYYL